MGWFFFLPCSTTEYLFLLILWGFSCLSLRWRRQRDMQGSIKSCNTYKWYFVMKNGIDPFSSATCSSHCFCLFCSDSFGPIHRGPLHRGQSPGGDRQVQDGVEGDRETHSDWEWRTGAAVPFSPAQSHRKQHHHIEILPDCWVNLCSAGTPATLKEGNNFIDWPACFGVWPSSGS